MQPSSPNLDRPGGEEWDISGFGYTATITSVGATLRRLTFGNTDLVVPFSADVVRPLFRGALIAPWPNRIADGRYVFAGEELQLPINEVDLGNALHGLVHWARWEPSESTPHRLVLHHYLAAQQGYPFTMRLTVEYEIRPAGLVTTLRSTNFSAVPAPYGCCPHPYLRLGRGRLDDWVLTLPARTRLEVDEQLRPTATVDAADVDCDFRTGRVIGSRAIDHAFTDLDFTDGIATASLTHRDTGDGVHISWTSWAPWIQVHTADRPEPEHHRAGVALEPMNCRPDAFNDPAGCPVLEPGQTHTATWLIGVIEAGQTVQQTF